MKSRENFETLNEKILTNFFKENENWENQFVSKVLNTHKGQCHSLPMLYKILANIGRFKIAKFCRL